jgi:hypothetical protein
MAKIKIGDRVKVRGDTQSYILTDPEKIYAGEVIGKEEGQLLVRLDKPVKKGPGAFREVTVPESNAQLSESGND